MTDGSSRETALEILSTPEKVQVLLLQEGIIIKGSLTDDNSNYSGTLLVAQRYQSSKTRNKESNITDVPSPESAAPADNIVKSNSCYLIWVPYTLLVARLPHLLSPEIKESVAVADGVDLLPEWSLTMCVAIENLARLHRRTNQRGKYVITLLHLDGHAECPLIFQYGGVTKFIDALKKVAPLRQSAVHSNDFILFGEDDVTRRASSAHTRSTARPAPPVEALRQPWGRPLSDADRQMLYDDTATKRTWADSVKKTVDRINNYLQTSHLQLENIKMQNGFLRKHKSPQPELSSPDQFDFVDVPIPIEHQIPHLPTPLPRGMGPALTRAQWDACFVSEERRLDPHRYAAARATAYAGGIEEEIRMQVWHYLLCVYSEDATQAQRETVRATYGQMYEKLTLQWTNVFPEQESRFSTFRELHSAILKDVVRTDRAHPAHADDDSVKQRMLRNVLMAHGMFNFDLGYSQGMSDMLSVIALLTDSETEAFTCFSCLLTERCESNFRRDVRVFMVEKLTALQTLLRHFVPKLHAHLVRQHAEDMSFCFRWLLMLFKREFSINDTMLLWDVIFSCPYTPQFELFVAAALLKALSPQILQQHLAYDELLKFANNVAGNLNVRDVIVLAQEFYDEVARLIAEIDKSREVPVESYKPTLKDVLRVLSEVE